MSTERSHTAVAFGTVLKRRRRAQDLSQEQLAEDCGLHPTYISMLERGLRQPSLETLIKLARALDLRGSELVALVEDYFLSGG